MTTRAQAWNHLKVNLLGLNPNDHDYANDPLKLALEQDGVDSLADFFLLSTQDINDLHYTDPTDDVKRPVPRHKKALLKVIKAFNAYYCRENNVFNLDWTTISKETFDNYRVNIYDPDETIVRFGRDNDANRNNIHDPLNVGVRQMRVPHQQANVFKKVIKREKTHYKPYKLERQWDDWHQGFRATTMTHDLRTSLITITLLPTVKNKSSLKNNRFFYILCSKNTYKLIWAKC